jgi:hypothetical protein
MMISTSIVLAAALCLIDPLGWQILHAQKKPGQSLTGGPNPTALPRPNSPAETRQQVIETQLRQASSRIAAGNRQTLGQDIRQMQTGFQGLVPFFGTFQPHDYERNRQLVRQAFGFLAQAEVASLGNVGLLGGVANGYGFLGDYSLNPGLRSYGFGPGAGFAFGRAGRLGRGLVLGNGGARFERDFERFALGWATQSLLFNGGFPFRVPQQEEPYVQPPVEARDPIQLPAVDSGALNASQKEAWDELRGEAIAVTGRVNETLNNLDLLAARLRARGFQPNSSDVAAAFRMQSFLEEANDQIKAKDFGKAKSALAKAEYERKRLKGVATQ